MRIGLVPVLVACLHGPAAAASAASDAPLRVVVCDSHHHVLRHWIEAAHEELLPRAGVDVVHFDAHPDLAVPANPLDRAWWERPGALVAAVDIASFQLAAVWVGLVDRVVWLRPTWATQIPDGARSMHVGEVPGVGMRVDDPSDYYVLDEGWAPSHALRDAVPLRLEVRALPSVDPGVPLHTGAAILDIDLDGFATRNPAAEALRAAGLREDELDLVRRAFARDRLDLPDDPEARAATLAEILGAVEAIAAGGVGDQLRGAFRLWWLGVPAGALYELHGIVGDVARPAAADALRASGRDLVGLPEHLTGLEDARETAGRLAELIGAGAVKPALVTIARSAHDGFTPLAEWALYETALLEALAGVRALDVRYDRGLQPAARP
jgi:hypothetical protein